MALLSKLIKLAVVYGIPLVLFYIAAHLVCSLLLPKVDPAVHSVLAFAVTAYALFDLVREGKFKWK